MIDCGYSTFSTVRLYRFTDYSRKLTGRFAQQGMIRAILWMFRTSKLLCGVSFKLRFNYFLIYQLFVWVLLVADVNLGYTHLSIIVKLTLKCISVT